MKPLQLGLSLTLAAALTCAAPAVAAEPFAPYGTAKVDMHDMPVTNVVFDVNYQDPKSLDILYHFIRNTWKETKGKVVVVSHGPELRAFAKENYEKYQAVVDQLAELAQEGVEFKMCNNALRAAGFQPEDMHGFVTVVPAGFPELAYWQSKGYQYINPLPLPVGGVRYLDQPQLKKP
ncbi:MAG TPA: DsrE family protein [Burkholderiales bacterium]|nr:DsrE family protein [Burkholderiales bacterium]